MNNNLRRLLAYWGKADPAYAGHPKWHPLAYHCLDVTAVASAWWESSAVVRRCLATSFSELPLNEERLRAWVLFFVALHDIGKADMRFQLKAPETVRELWPALKPSDVDAFASKGFDHGRGGYSAALAEITHWGGRPKDESALSAWRDWIAAVTAHHGDIPQSSDRNSEYAEQWIIEQDRVARRILVEELAALFLAPAGLTLADAPPPSTRASQALLAGFCAVCDWIGSNTDYFPYECVDHLMAGYFTARMDRAISLRVLSNAGLIARIGKFRGVQALLGQYETPRGVQTLVDGLPDEPGLTILEAPTGSGKTEAALAYAWRLLDAGLAESVVFALPTQATANAMLSRAEQFGLHAFESSNVVLAHGNRQMNAEFRRLVEAGRFSTAQGAEEASAQCSTWLAQSRKRVFLGQIGVCTVDQVLLSVLPVRHKFVRGFGLARSVIVVDEVHAYDTYMHGLLREVLRRQKAAGGSAILLSATLPSRIRNELLSAWDAPPLGAANYPAVWISTAHRAEMLEVPSSQRPPIRHVETEVLKLPHAFPDQPACERIIAAADAGGLVAVITNLVDDAQRLARHLRSRTEIPVDLFHARYRLIDRQQKESIVAEHYGRFARRTGGRILVATQVVEQSLDLDFDRMFTQICPVDLLFQRMGRLHRHERTRPRSHVSPRCTVFSVHGDDYGPHKLIYGDIRVLWRTERLLAATRHVVFPAAYREWIERVYADEDEVGEPETVARAHRDFIAKQLAASWEARQMIETSRKSFSDDDVSITVKTRDGERSLTVLPVRADGRALDGADLARLDEPYRREALALNLVSVPMSWAGRLAGCARDEDGRILLSFDTESEGKPTARIGTASLTYTTDFGLERNADGSA